MTDDSEFEPDWCSAPGETIADVCTERGIPFGELARDLGISDEDAANLIAGRMTLTSNLAERLSMVLGSTPAFWLEREAQYRKDATRLAQKERCRTRTK